MNLQYGQYPYQVDQIPAGYCTAPPALLADLNGDIVTLSWVPPHAVLYFVLRIIRTSDSAVLFSGNIKGTRYITQLAPLTEYRAELETVCADDPLRKAADVRTVTFTTGEHVVQCLPVNTALVLATMLPDSVLLSWPANSDARAYTVYYRTDNSTLPYSTIATQILQAKLPLLLPNTDYDYYIVTHCTDGKDAASEVGSFRTPLDEESCPVPKINVILNGTTAVAVWPYTGVHQAYDIYLNGAPYLLNYPANILNLTNLQAMAVYTLSVVGRCGSGLSIAGTTSFTTGGDACGAPTNLQHAVVNGQADLTWNAVAGVVGYTVVVNGKSVDVADSLYSFAVVPGTTYNVEVYARCASGRSLPVYASFVTEGGCSAIAATDLVTTPGPLSIRMDWPDKAGVLSYRWRYRVSPAGAWSSYNETGNSELLAEGLTPLTAYDFDIDSLCAGGAMATVSKTVYTNGLTAGLQPVITSFSNKTPTGFCVHFTVGSKLKGSFVAKVRHTVTNVVTEHSGEELTICVDGKEPHTEYEVIIEDRTPGYTIVPSLPAMVTTCYLCATVGNLTAVFLPNGDIKVDWTAALGAVQYKVWSLAPLEGAAWKEEATTAALTHTIAGTAFQYRTIKVQSIYTDCNNSCEIETLITCPRVSGLVSEVEGTVANLSWTPVYGVLGYKVLINSLTSTPLEEYVTDPHISVDGLEDETTYSWTVQAVCTTIGSGEVSEPALFTTGAQTPPDTGCPEPDVEATSQDSVLSDPTTPDVPTVDNSAASILNYTTYQGDSFDRTWSFKQADGITPRDITGYTFEWKILRADNSSVVVATLQNYLTNGGATGVVSVNLPVSVTELIAVGTYIHELRWTSPTNVTKLVITGKYDVLKPNLYDPNDPIHN